MAIVGGLDVHRRQITFDVLDTDTGDVRRGRILGVTRERFRKWLGQFAGEEVDLACEGCAGWRFVVEEIERAGFRAHLAEPADTAALRGRKRRAKTDGADARLMREALVQGRLPESWIAPAHVLEVRARVRLYKALVDMRRQWQQRLHAVLFHHGLPAVEGSLVEVRDELAAHPGLTPAAREQIAVAYRMIDHANAELVPLRRSLAAFARQQQGCRALMAHYGIGTLVSVAVWSELGDPRRFRSSDQAVRHTGLDVTVSSSDGKHRGRARLARQGPPILRWALYEAGQAGARATSPDHDYYTAVKDRLGANRAALSLARKLARRSYHTLRELGDAAYEPVG
jgi:transposase